MGNAGKRRFIWWALAGVILASLVTSVLVVNEFADKFGECNDRLLASIASPDGQKSIVVFRRECAATVGYSSHVSLVPAGETFSASRHAPFLSIDQTPEILATWRGNDLVEIALIPGSTRVFRRDLRVGDVRIDYK